MRKFLSALYRLIIDFRNHLYDTGLKTAYHAGVPVVSIGNIEVGGTGKTPFTIALAIELQKRGRRPAVVTRGYKGRLKGVVQVKPGHSFREVGDEALLMAKALKIPVVKSPDRLKGARFAHETLHADIVLLDDGFQHRRLHRDLDIVLVSDNISTAKLLPAGTLREPAASLNRADIIVYTKGAPAGDMRAELVATSLTDTSGSVLDLSLLKGKRVLAVSGIGKPAHFAQMLESLGASVESLSFRDHHAYTSHDMETIRSCSGASDMIITTEKDLVRMAEPIPGKKILALRVEMHVNEMETIMGEIENIVQKSGIPRQG